MHRRHFLRSAAAAAGTVSLNHFPYPLFAANSKKFASDRVQLGPRGVEVTRLAMGTGTNGGGGSSNQTKKMGVEGMADWFRAAYDQGITFWDAADQIRQPSSPQSRPQRRTARKGRHPQQDPRLDRRRNEGRP